MSLGSRVAPVADARAAVRRGERAQRERTYPDRLYRRLSDLIDAACDQVELVNLSGGFDCSAEVAVFVQQLQHQAGVPIDRPSTSIQAHDELMRLSCVLLGRPEVDLICDREADRAAREAER